MLPMNSKINVTFLHPTNGQYMEVEIDGMLTAAAAINELIASNFIQSIGSIIMPGHYVESYSISSKDFRNIIGDQQTFVAANIADGSTLQIIPVLCHHRQEAFCKNINVKFIHPTNNSDIDIGLPEKILLGDVFNQLVDANFLTAKQHYTGIVKHIGELDNDKTVKENGLKNNDTVQIIVATQADGGPEMLFWLITELCTKYKGLEIHETEKLEGKIMAEMESLCVQFLEESKKFGA